MTPWLLLLLFLALPMRAREPGPRVRQSVPAGSPSASAALSSQGRAELQTVLSAARLAELRWPDFSNYKKDVTEFYRSTGYSPAWTLQGQPTRQAIAMISVLENADAEGLVPADYDGSRWAGRIAALEGKYPPSESDLIRFDVALTVSAMRYLSDVHDGRVDPRLFHSGFQVERLKYDLAQFLARRIIHASNIQPALDEIDPPFPLYDRTIAALHTYQKLAREYHGQPLPVPQKTVDPGDVYAAVPQLAELLRLLGDLPPNARISPSETVYQGPLVGAIEHFQSRHGLDPDGRIGPQTFAQLNTPLAHRVRELRLSLERLRWLPQQFDVPPIIVNIPEFRLHAMNAQHRQALSMKVVVGRAYGHKTPVLASAIQSVVFRPYWNVPLSIQVRELVPDIRKNPRYLLEHGYEVVDSQQRVVSEGKVSPAILQALASGTLFARQKPGPQNALDSIKFDLPNNYSVYLHGTPAVTLFSRSRRDFSHGCIRVEDPVALAAWVLRNNPGWTPAQIREAMDGNRTFTVDLAKPIPILIVYGTAMVEESGEIRFFSDIYGLDAQLERALASDRPYPTPTGTGSGQ